VLVQVQVLEQVQELGRVRGLVLGLALEPDRGQELAPGQEQEREPDQGQGPAWELA
jgi:hypothetical protein